MVKLSTWQLIISPPLSGPENMDIDRNLFRQFERDGLPPTLRIYRWKTPCISVGYSQSIESKINSERCGGLGLDVVKRPTGGGILLHNEVEITYSVVANLGNNMLDSYKLISQAIIVGLKKLGIEAELSKRKKQKFTELCYSYPASHEVTVHGRKLVGSAQRRGRCGFLQQGSVFVEGVPLPAISIKEILGRVPGFEELSQALIAGFKEVLSVNF